MHPMIELTVDGKPVAGAFYERLMEFSCEDKEGIESDRFDARLLDGPPAFLEMPRKGAVVVAKLGYRETGLRQVGRYVVDTIKGACLPYSVSIGGKAADLRKGKLKTRSERHWDNETVQKIVEDVAGDAGWSAKVSEAIGQHRYKWFGQQDETPGHFLERLARRHNALFAVKDGIVIFAERGAGLSLSGASMGQVIVTPDRVIEGTLEYEFNDRQAYGKVTAYYQDRNKAKRIEMEVSAGGASDSVYRLPEPYADAAEADKAAQAKAKQLKRGEGSFSVEMPGDTGLVAGAPLICRDIRPGLDGVPWLIDGVTHSFSKAQGFRSKISAKLWDGQSGKGAGTGAGAGSASGDTPAKPPPPNAPDNVKAGAPDGWGAGGLRLDQR
ncbi:phage late control D family protein [Bosea sp. MMO-172]|uniref:phage late control D family protein n=1 Tax=Bosea sp. MMO-172 TaxID=3127885 RepID=UPI0030172AF6